uniref:Uncharacterized protein n=1 Tax=Anguilla anguilla TaxID=7936 RepID=A0A0E9WF25_ANGAN
MRGHFAILHRNARHTSLWMTKELLRQLNLGIKVLSWKRTGTFALGHLLGNIHQRRDLKKLR